MNKQSIKKGRLPKGMVPFKKGDIKTIEAGRKGGRARTKIKTLQNRLKGYNSSKNKAFYFDEKIRPMLDDPELMAGVLLTHLSELKKMIDVHDKVELKIQLQRLLDDTFKTIHGERKVTKNVNVNINVEADSILDRIAKYKGVEVVEVVSDKEEEEEKEEDGEKESETEVEVSL